MEEIRPVPYTPLSNEEVAELRYAKNLLENPGFTARLANVLGSPIEKKTMNPRLADAVSKLCNEPRLPLSSGLVAEAAGLSRRRASCCGQRGVASISGFLHKVARKDPGANSGFTFGA